MWSICKVILNAQIHLYNALVLPVILHDTVVYKDKATKTLNITEIKFLYESGQEGNATIRIELSVQPLESA